MVFAFFLFPREIVSSVFYLAVLPTFDTVKRIVEGCIGINPHKYGNAKFIII